MVFAASSNNQIYLSMRCKRGRITTTHFECIFFIGCIFLINCSSIRKQTSKCREVCMFDLAPRSDTDMTSCLSLSSSSRFRESQLLTIRRSGKFTCGIRFGMFHDRVLRGVIRLFASRGSSSDNACEQSCHR
jgi:hypothetical protein